MKNKPRRRYTEEFKADAVRLVLEEGISVIDVSTNLDIGSGSLYQWVNKAKENPPLTPQGDDVYEELKRLRKENRILKEEREILKKAAAFFAMETK